jgi:hypothetical protein
MPVLLALLLALVLAAPAAASPRDVLLDCTDDEVLTQRYSQADYAGALAMLAADKDEYGNCRAVIERARKAALEGAGAGDPLGLLRGVTPGTDTLASATPAERAEVEAAVAAVRRGGDGPVRLRVGDETVTAERPRIAAARALPGPLAWVVGVLALALLALAGGGRRRGA